MPKRNEEIDYNRLQQTKYDVEVSMVGLRSDQTTPLILHDRNIVDVLVDCDYRNFFHPILKIKLALNASVLWFLKENKDTSRIIVKFKKFSPKSVSEVNLKNHLDDKAESYTILFEKRFQPFYEDINPNIFGSLNESELMEKDIDLLNEGSESSHMIELILFAQDHLDMNKKIINAILMNATPLQAIGFLVNETDIYDMLMVPVDNSKAFRQIIFPPINLKEGMDHLSKTYGIYKKGLFQFLDFNRYYLLTNTLDYVPVPEGEYENVLVNFGSLFHGTSFLEGSYRDDEKKMYKTTLPNAAIHSTSGLTTQEISGNSITVYDSEKLKESTSYDDAGNFNFGTGSSQLDLDLKTHGSSSKRAFTYNSTSNEYNLSEEEQSALDRNLSISAKFNNIDLELLTPNKRYFLNFEDEDQQEKYAGMYRLVHLTYGYLRDGDTGSMAMFANCEFKLYKKN